MARPSFRPPFARTSTTPPRRSCRPTRAPVLEQLECRELLSNVVTTPFDDQQPPRDVQYTEPVVASALRERTTRPTGFLRGAESIDGTTIRVDFDKRISRRVADRLDFEIAGLDVTNIQTARNRRSVLLTTTPQDNMVYIVQASVVKNSAGKTHVLRNGTAPVAGKAAPRVINIETTSDTSFLVTYDRPMGASAINPANYTLSGENGQPIAVTGAQFVGQVASMVEVRTTPQSYTNYSFNIQNVADSTGQQIFFEGRKMLTGNPKGAVISVAATSPTRVVVAFNEPMADNALAPQHYTIKDPSGKPLLVTDVQFDGPLTMTFVLTTAAQTNVNYQLTVSNVTDLQNDGLTINTGSFQGIASPSLVKATPTDSTHIVLTFGGSVGDSALAPSTYKIDKLDAQGNVVGSLPVLGVTFIGDQRKVVELTTPPQEDARYRVSTTSALTDVAGSPLPVTQQEIQGIGSHPTLASVSSTGPNTLLLTFSEPMSDDALSPSAYVIKSPNGTPLRILGAQFIGTERRLVELTTENQANVAYTVASIAATDLDGNTTVVPASPTINTFPGKGTLSEAPEIAGPPRVVGAGSLSNTELLVVFSEPMADSAKDPRNYIITQVNENPAAGVLRVTAAEFYLGNPSVVKLTTLSQNELSYQVTVIGATDRAGNALAPEITNGGGTTDPTSSSFPGTPPNATTQRDSDGDGLLDSEEMRGWTVTVRLANGTVVERGVTSDPTLPDTDGDGIADHVELAVRSDPRDADTDDDQLPDLVELRDNLGDPAKQDSDDDGLTDLAEKIGWTINITLGDGSVVTRQVTSNPYLADTDLDGLLDRLEKIVQVDPRNPDSDGDGASDGREVIDGKNPTTNNPTDKTAAANEAPRVTGATSLSNTEVIVAFNKPMADSAIQPSFYSIVQRNVNSEAGFLAVTGASWYDVSHTVVKLSTVSQSELTYQVTVVVATDVAGNPLAPPVLAGGIRIDPASTTFHGTPPRHEIPAGTVDSNGDGVIDSNDPAVPATLVDTDGDGLTDNEEQRGWSVTFRNADGTFATRFVTSDIYLIDSDADGFPDNVENQLKIDPRDQDTDDDLITDWQEYNEVFSDHLNADTDRDGVDDGTEFIGVHSSPLFADSDGDQIDDGTEIGLGGYRNVRVADLPRTEITVGEVKLELDVRFSESNAQESRDLETRTATTTLTRSDRQAFSRSDTVNVEAHMDFTGGKGEEGWVALLSVGASVGYTFNQSSESETESQSEYEQSLSTDKEVTRGFTVERVVEGALMQATVSLRNVSNLAYRVKNLQVTAFIQDPQDHSKLTPIATLLPDAEPEDGYVMGPFVTDRGPIIVKNTSIIPSMVESLMANSSGLIFRISNYDIINEDGRNFAFVSQDVADRTARLVFDFGGARSLRAQVTGEQIDENAPGDETQIYRVDTGAGRAINDTNGDGLIDSNDRRVTFDLLGKQVGITLFDAMSAIYLTRFEARLDPASGEFQEFLPGESTPFDFANQDELFLNSYSTYKDTSGREKIHRIRGVANDAVNQRYWEILTPLGIDRITDLNNVILRADAPASLNFVKDLDGDGMPADVEYFVRTSDSPTPGSTASAPTSTDSNSETITFASDPNYPSGTLVHASLTGGGLTKDRHYYVRNLGGGTYGLYGTLDDARGVTSGAAINLTANISAIVGVPSGRDSDKDGFDDRFESMIGWTIDNGLRRYQAYPSPTRKDSNFDTPKIGIDSDENGIEDRFQYDGSDGFAAPSGWNDSNHNGLRDRFEVFQTGPTYVGTTPSSTDVGNDRVQFASDPGWHTPTVVRVSATGNGGGLTNGSTYFIRSLPNGNYSFYVSASDAGQGGIQGRVNLVSNVTAEIAAERPDYVLDPMRKDTDLDGISDATEIIGFTITRITTGSADPVIVRSTDPTTAFTDSDTFTDGFEKLVGLDPTDGNDTDDDGDGLPDPVEETGWDVRVTGVSTTPFQEGPLSINLRKSHTDSVDSDEDGITDYDEFFLGSDPVAADSDGDGINDRIELRGYVLGHKVGALDIGIIETKPLDADTDNDMRSDGDEAELVDIESKRWVIFTNVKAPYRVFSDPRFADGDFDGLVDGQEFGGTYRTDPNNSDTDGDERGDGTEVTNGDNPLLASLEESVRITIVAQYIILSADGDGDSGEIESQLWVRGPDATGIAGLSNSTNFVLNPPTVILDDQGPTEGFGDWYYFSSAPYNLSLNQYSYSFTLAKGQRFSVEGRVREYDGSNAYLQFDLGGLTGISAYTKPLALDGDPVLPAQGDEWTRTVFTYDQVLSKPMQQFYFQFDTDEFPFTITPNAGDRLAGELSFLIIVS
jgi:hypothetical protein